MSLTRVALVAIQALCNHRACKPPNATPAKGRYHTDELYILQLAPVILKGHLIALWICTFFETLFYLGSLVPVSSSFTATSVCLSSQPSIRTTPLFVIGTIAVALGTYIRVDCFRALGTLFTFDLTIAPEHHLVTRRFYAYVRHPAYTGSMLLIAGLAFAHLSQGSWLTECGPLSVPGSAAVIWAVWWLYTLAVGLSRAEAEDREMHKLFSSEWEAYAAAVPWWFFPGLI